MRSLFGGAAAALLIVLAIPAPAQAADNGYDEATSGYDSTATKFAVVDCPEGEAVYSAGGRVNPPGAQVALIGVVPSADLSSVTAVARARAGYLKTWSVTAIVVCGTGQPELAVGVGVGGTAVADCPTDTVVYSTGFSLPRTTGTEYLDFLQPSSNLDTVTARAKTTVPGAIVDVVAYGICAPPLPRAERTQAVSNYESSLTKTATARKPLQQPDFGSAMYGAGITVRGAAAFITGFGVLSTLDGAFGNATLIATIKLSARTADTDDDGWDVTVYGTTIGSWY